MGRRAALLSCTLKSSCIIIVLLFYMSGFYNATSDYSEEEGRFSMQTSI